MRKISKQFNGERIVFSTDDVETTGHPYTHTHTHTHTHTQWVLTYTSHHMWKNNSKLLKDIKAKPKIIKLLEENTAENLLLGLIKHFLARTQKAQTIRCKHWIYQNFKSSALLKTPLENEKPKSELKYLQNTYL